MMATVSNNVICIVCKEKILIKNASFVPGEDRVRYVCNDCNEIINYCDLDYTPEGLDMARFILQAQKDFDEVYEKQLVRKISK